LVDVTARVALNIVYTLLVRNLDADERAEFDEALARDEHDWKEAWLEQRRRNAMLMRQADIATIH
jgi:hypothetical protein